MCGRYALFSLPPELIEKILGFVPIDEHGLLVPRWNIAPTQRAPVFRVGAEGRRSLDPLRWGLVPSWADDLKFGAKTINARSETVAGKPAFRAALRARRCLVPASGFYEWSKTGGPKRPYFFRGGDGAPLLLAGLFESWTDKATGEIVETFAILPRAAAPPVSSVHDRMPVALAAERWDAWLDPSTRDAAAVARLIAEPGPQLVAVPVGLAVNNARNDGPELVAPVDEDVSLDR
jgi:putative SOS response-associated peptidase YedK